MKYVLNTVSFCLFALSASGILALIYNLINGVSGDFGIF